MLLSLQVVSQTLKVLPLQPSPGDTIEISYDPTGGALESDPLTSCRILLYSDFQMNSRKVPLVKDNGVYKAFVPTDSLAQLIAFSFSAEKKTDRETNGITRFYRNGKTVEGAYYLTAELYLGQSGKNLFGFDKEYAKAISFYEKEREFHPDGKFRISVIQGYLKCLLKADSVHAVREANALLDSVNSKGKLTDLDMLFKFRVYEAINQGEAAQKTLADLQKAYPSSPVIFSRRYKEVVSPQPAEEMETLALALIADYNMINGAEFNYFLPSVYGELCKQYSKELNLEKFHEYLSKLTNPAAIAYNCHLAAISLLEAGQEISEAEKLGRRSIELADSSGLEKSNPMQYGGYLSVLGEALLKQQRDKESLLYLSKAHALSKGASPEIDLLYATSLARDKQFQIALPFFESSIQHAEVDSALKKLFHDTWLAVHGNDDKFQWTLDTLLARSAANRKEVLKKEMLNEKAPSFQLKDLQGKRVGLEQLKGKIVVLDFWADWCVPCKMAFPGMQQLLDLYDKDKDVVILFIHTLDNFAVDLKPKIKKYLQDRKFSFRVLMDERLKNDVSSYQVATPYGIKALPQKIIIDRNGIIRFRSTGYEGSSEKLVSKMKDMIELTRML
ncbi:redoxin domain-containing protein [Terrimonas sp. NA20]|uniref:Redoxin domain-containing protein n=1 Tax=Terrimonas ginsenosidimutans TaxID=2908004 RepID=A0ABS9KNI2_9BACT|nr:redoxin domain-containing protein [Terrimonas ginsenosidimutans]MCG2613879.1 redoxin domain-containing protein [Terrimonas ginsenosidimutans]